MALVVEVDDTGKPDFMIVGSIDALFVVDAASVRRVKPRVAFVFKPRRDFLLE